QQFLPAALPPPPVLLRRRRHIDTFLSAPAVDVFLGVSSPAISNLGFIAVAALALHARSSPPSLFTTTPHRNADTFTFGIRLIPRLRSHSPLVLSACATWSPLPNAAQVFAKVLSPTRLFMGGFGGC
ncbi:hypothetical protein TARUN_9545, partial [Trichoderma arundinaceum]